MFIKLVSFPYPVQNLHSLDVILLVTGTERRSFGINGHSVRTIVRHNRRAFLIGMPFLVVGICWSDFLDCCCAYNYCPNLFFCRNGIYRFNILSLEEII